MYPELEREGIAQAKREAPHKYPGRRPTARQRAHEVLRLHRAGLRKTEIAERLGISRSSVYRILADVEEAT